MSVSIHVTDPTPAECTALIAYLQSVAGIVVTERVEVRVGELSHSVTNVVNHHTTPAEDMTSLLRERAAERASASGESIAQSIADEVRISGKHAGIVDVPTEVLTEHYVSHFMDAPVVAIPSFMDAPVEVVVNASIDTASIFGGTPERAVPPPAPAMQVPLAHVATSGTELDIFNLPWDGRIHAATKAKIADGSWRQRRGVDPALVQQVEAELRGIMGVPAPIVHAAPPAPSAHVAPPAPVSPVPAHVAATDAPVVPAAANPFAAFMAFMTPLIVGKIITTPQLGSICVSLGLPHAGALAQRHDLIPAVQARVQAILDGGAA